MPPATRYPRFARPTSFSFCCRLALLPGLLALAYPLAAQQLPDPADGNDRPVPGAVNAQYRRLRVRAVLVQRQYADRTAPGHPLLREPAGYYEYDAQGRLVRHYSDDLPHWPLLIRRFDHDYTPGGELATVSVWNRLDPETDSTLLGRTWLPNAASHYPPATGGQGFTGYWDEATGDWKQLERLRRYQRHDTTYLATTSLRTGRLAELTRSYAAGRHLQRLDQLSYDDQGLRSTHYTYTLTDAQGHPIETGRLSFADAYAAAGLPPEPTRPTPAHDALARRRAGQRQPLYTQTYNAKGQLTSRQLDPELRGTYRYNAAGQLLETQVISEGQPLRTTTYTYRPDGLLGSIGRFGTGPAVREELVYRYFFR